MSLVVIGMAVVVFALQRHLLTTSAVVFTLVLLVPAVIVDLMVLFGPRAGSHEDPLSRRYRTRRRGD
jgi:hypothetical protein